MLPGLTVAPGFIDIHNHSDLHAARRRQRREHDPPGRDLDDLGEGGSAAPVGGKQQRAASASIGPTSRYFARCSSRVFPPTSAPMSARARSGPMCAERRPAPPTPGEAGGNAERMVRQAMEQGALGVSSSLSGPPGAWIDTDTLVAMCEAAAQYGGIYSTHMRTEGRGVFEAVDGSDRDRPPRQGCPWTSSTSRSPSTSCGARCRSWSRPSPNARARGQEVEAHVYPYRAGQNNLSSIIPPWAHEGGSQAMIARLKDPALRDGSRARSTTESRLELVQPLHGDRLLGRDAAGLALESRSTRSSKASG